MKIRLTSDNMLDNEGFELYDNDIPVGWSILNPNVSVSGGELQLRFSDTDLFYPKGLVLVDEKNNTFDFIKIKKSAKVKGVGTWYNAIGTPARIIDSEVDYTYYSDIIGDSNPKKQTRFYEVVDSDSTCNIKEIKTEMILETELLRIPNYNYNNGNELHIVHNLTGKELNATNKYIPVNTRLDFICCNNEAWAINTFFKTCIKYGRGATIEAFITPESSTEWGSFEWGSEVWGGINPAGEWIKVFKVDLSNTNMNRSSVSANISVNCILQKTELKGVDIIGTN